MTTRPFLTLRAVGFCIMGSYAILLGALPAALAQRGLAASSTGLLLAGFPVGIIATRFVAAWFIDAVAWRAMIGLGALLAAVAALLTLSPDPGAIALSRLLHGAGFAAVAASAVAATAYHSPVERRGRQLGLYLASTALAMVAFPPLGIVIFRAAGYGPMPWIAAASALAAALLGLRIRGRPERSGSAPAPETRARLLLIAAAALCALPLGALESTLPYIGRAWAISNLAWIYLVWGLAVAIGRALGGGLGDRFGRARLGLIGLGAAMVGQVTAGLSGGDAWLYVGAVAGGLGLGVATSNLTAAVSVRTARQDQGRVLSLSDLLFNVVFALGATFGGAGFQMGAATPFMVSAAVMAAAGGLLALSAIPRPQPA